jgi:hypothetical protein
MAKASTTTTPSTSTSTEGTKKKYKTLILGLGANRNEIMGKLNGIATELGCKVQDLMWHGASLVVANPPKTAPAGATANAGTSPGFWVLHTNDKNGKLTNVKVVEVAARNQIKGGDRLFVRFTKGDDKARNRAMAQAIKAANYDLSLVGIKREVEATKFDGSEE